jgi:hypothetical protein
MESTIDTRILEENILQQNPVLRNWLTSESEIWTGYTTIFALFLFILWSVRLEFGLLTWVFIIDLYCIGILTAVRNSDYHTISKEENGNHKITFIKSAIAWRRITDILIGLAIISTAFVYMFINTLPNNLEFVSFIYSITLILHVLIFPIIPALAKIQLLAILKSRINIVFDNIRIISVIPEIHPLDNQMPIDDLITERTL